ncbi:uncharacterized protein [Rutidosis leptorrhynchoides]|uniref:uncharacterized protein n=1 Tax=Rutidosis leptorrhynchoides TaxID=125765 RepID=UPI003A993A45
MTTEQNKEVSLVAIFDSWFDRPDFDDTVKLAWDLISVDSDLDIVAKFRLLKGHLKNWIHNTRSNEAKRLKEITGKIEDLDIIIDSGFASNIEVDTRNSLESEKNELLKISDLDSLQKARVKWDVEGDENSIFFHSSLKRTRRIQHIQGLLVDGVWLDDPNVIKETFFDHFKAKFDLHEPDLFCDDMGPARVLTYTESSALEATSFDFCTDIRNFFVSCSMPRGANSAFFSLITKIHNPMLITDFRPISLVGCFYKTDTKILTNRLQGIIDKIISPVQTTFISGRQILDGPLMLSEIIDWYKRKNKKMLMFKVDFEKAYGSVNWEYLLSMLSILGYADKWCSWIRGCLFTARTRILLILEVFYKVSGIKLNINKSHVFGIGVDQVEVDYYASATGTRVGMFPTSYLGIPIGSNMKIVSNWNSLCEKFRSKHSTWKASLISVGGRLTLIKSVMGSLGIYWFSIFKCPETEKVLASFDKGGLNIGSLKAFNIALVFKWWWRFLIKPNDLWTKMIKSIHGPVFLSVHSHSTVWTSIVSVCSRITDTKLLPTDTFRMTIGDGCSVRFWHDLWVGNNLLSHRFNRLLHLDSNPNVFISDKWVDGNWLFTWVRDNLGGRIENCINNLLEIIGKPVLSDRPDYWTCSLNNDGVYTVKKARELIDLRWNLSAKGIDVSSIVCPSCNNGVETRDHLFFDYEVARDLWYKIRIWLDCDMPQLASWDSFLAWLEGIRLRPSSKDRIVAVTLTCLWAIWRYRNGIVFLDPLCNKSSLFDFIRLIYFRWIKHMSHLVSNWNLWLSMPL